MEKFDRYIGQVIDDELGLTGAKILRESLDYLRKKK